MNSRQSLNQTILGQTQFGFATSKKDMKLGRTHLGSLVAQSLELWIRSTLHPEAPYEEPVVAFIHSGSYKLEHHIQPGPITVALIKGTYPYRNKAKAYRMLGHEIASLYFSLKDSYSKDDPQKFTPQMNFNIRESDGTLEVFYLGSWTKLKRKTSYIIVFDGWLSTQNYG